MNRWRMGSWRCMPRLVVVAAVTIGVGVFTSLHRPLMLLAIPGIPRDYGVALALCFLALLWLDIVRRARLAASAQSAPWLLTENLIIWVGFLVGWFARKGVIGFGRNRGWSIDMAGLSFDLRVVTMACWIATTMLTLAVLYRQSKANTRNISPNQ